MHCIMGSDVNFELYNYRCTECPTDFFVRENNLVNNLECVYTMAMFIQSTCIINPRACAGLRNCTRDGRFKWRHSYSNTVDLQFGQRYQHRATSKTRVTSARYCLHARDLVRLRGFTPCLVVTRTHALILDEC